MNLWKVQGVLIMSGILLSILVMNVTLYVVNMVGGLFRELVTYMHFQKQVSNPKLLMLMSKPTVELKEKKIIYL